MSTVLFLALVEDAPSYAALHATGWDAWSLGRVVITQSVVVGVLGSAAGCVGAVVTSATVIGPVTRSVLVIALAVVVGTVVLCVVAAAGPAALVRRMPAAQILARQ